MYGWWTKHQEFTLAKGDPEIIKYLIFELSLDYLVSFDEENSLITTTIKHDQYIRLSDLLSLNVFDLSKQLSKIIVFTVEQIAEVMKQLLEYLQNMTKYFIQHGNLTMENIILDLTQSDDKLGNTSNFIIFKLKLINFAQFYNLQMEDDLERALGIYKQITQLFPEYTMQVNPFQNQMIQQDQSFIQGLFGRLVNLGIQVYQDFTYIWDSDQITNFISNYTTSKQPLSNLIEINDLIEQLHQYHLIIHHYTKIYQYYLNFNAPLNYQSEPTNFIQTCSFLDKLFDLNQILNIDNNQISEQIEAEKSFNQTIQLYRDQIKQKLIIFLKQNGYLESISKFVKIILNIDQINDFIKGQFTIFIYQNFQNNVNILEMPINIQNSFPISLKIITNLMLFQILNIEIDNKIPQFNQILTYMKNIRKALIITLNQIITYGYLYSTSLIDYCIKILGEQLKEQYLPNREKLIQFMVDSWLSWIDQQIVNKQIISLQQLEQFNQYTFIYFIQKQGQQLLNEEIKKYIVLIVDQIFSQINN